MPASVLRLVSGLVCLVLTIVGLPAVSAADGARAPTKPHKHTIAEAAKGASFVAAARTAAPVETWASVDDDDDDDDDVVDDDEGVTPDPDVFGPTSRLPLPGPAECGGTTFHAAPTGGTTPSTRQLPDDPP